MNKMNVESHVLGFPRIGANREMKHAVESYWQNKTTQADLLQTGKEIRKAAWSAQKEAGLDRVTVGDYAWYDHVLNHSAMFGVIPARFEHQEGSAVDLDTIFRVARGRAPTGKPAYASEMTKWFDTNYHYIVPELKESQNFQLSYDAIFNELDEAIALEHKVKPVLLGPVSYLYLGKCAGTDFDKSKLLAKLLPVYQQILQKFADKGIDWVQIDEPITSFDLSATWQQALQTAYQDLTSSEVKILLTCYFGTLESNSDIVAGLPVAGIHIDAIRGEAEVNSLLGKYKQQEVISIGIVNGRNIWRNNLSNSEKQLQLYASKLDDNQQLWVASSCSLLHVPVDLAGEDLLDAEIKNWLAFAKQKTHEVAHLANALNGNKNATAFADSDAAATSHATSTKVHNSAVTDGVAAVTDAMTNRQSAYIDRIQKQREHLNLPKFPTTNIGSFPQTEQIRQTRRDLKSGTIDKAAYDVAMKKEIELVVTKQEEIGLDVLVHGEPERNDMVEYFGELMEGYAFTKNGWVQSYGSRCVKPPVIYGDVSRPKAMTVEWSAYAQSLSTKKVKAMLTGPVTMLFWSFVRDDIPREQTCYQIGLALRDEVTDLEKAGINVIQIDEPAFREGLPLRQDKWQSYLNWAVRSFRLTASGVTDTTQIHTHMCYSEFNDIIDSIAALDADVITIETSRSNMELLEAFESFKYPNDIGPGVYDIHSPNIPTVAMMVDLMEKATKRIPIDQLWVNPDCGLKTRKWDEVLPALVNMVESAKELRKKFA